MLRVDFFCQPLRKREIVLLDGELVATSILDRPKQFIVGKVLEYRVALAYLARADQPQIDCALAHTQGSPRLQFCPQCQAVELRKILALVKLFINTQVTSQIAVADEIQRVAVA